MTPSAISASANTASPSRNRFEPKSRQFVVIFRAIFRFPKPIRKGQALRFVVDRRLEVRRRAGPRHASSGSSSRARSTTSSTHQRPASRGNYRSALLRDDGAKLAFLAYLDEACEKTGWEVHTWCVRSNHFHLALATPRGNLVAGMQWLQSTFALRFHRYRRECGHLFQGRYKSLLIDPADALGPLGHSIHLNPVRTGITTVERLGDGPWSSLRWLLRPKERATWFRPMACLQHAGGLADTPAGRQKYAEYLAWLAENAPEQKRLRFDRMSKGWANRASCGPSPSSRRRLKSRPSSRRSADCVRTSDPLRCNI